MSNREPTRSQEAYPFKDRRKKADWITNMAAILSLVSWVVAFAVWVLLDRASPESEDMFTRMFSVEVRSNWDASLLPIAFVLLIASLCTCVLAFIFNMLRKRRKTDKYKKSILIAGGISILGIVFFIIRFGVVL